MSEHPSPFELESFLVGESNPALDAHRRLPRMLCYLDELRSERTVLNEMPAAEFFQREGQAAFLEADTPKGMRWLASMGPVLAACVVALLSTRSGTDRANANRRINELNGDIIRMKGQSFKWRSFNQTASVDILAMLRFIRGRLESSSHHAQKAGPDNWYSRFNR